MLTKTEMNFSEYVQLLVSFCEFWHCSRWYFTAASFRCQSYC